MAQKINPTSFRIGIQKSWILTLQSYGKNLKISKISLQFLWVLTLLKLFSKKLLFTSYSFIISQSQIFFIFYFFHEQKKTTFLSVFFKHCQIYFRNWFLVPSKIRFFYKSKFFLSSSLVLSYAATLIRKSWSLKKIVLLITQLLNLSLNKTKVINSKFGLKRVKLKGFKVDLNGRFENSKSQMSSYYQQVVGTLPLISLNNHIEFSSLTVLTKLGSCTIRIWLFFN